MSIGTVKVVEPRGELALKRQLADGMTLKIERTGPLEKLNRQGLPPPPVSKNYALPCVGTFSVEKAKGLSCQEQGCRLPQPAISASCQVREVQVVNHMIIQSLPYWGGQQDSLLERWFDKGWSHAYC